jgi:hypothetical protein
MPTTAVASTGLFEHATEAPRIDVGERAFVEQARIHDAACHQMLQRLS